MTHLIAELPPADYTLHGWACVPMGEWLHVVPYEDTRLHYLDPQGSCWCKPANTDENNPFMWIHQAADQRQEYELGKRKPN